VTTSTGGYSANSASDGSYAIPSVAPGSYSVTASKLNYAPQTQSASVASNQTTTVSFSLSFSPSEKMVNGDMEGGFFDTGWATTCSGNLSRLPAPSGAWNWNNEGSYPFNTFDSTSIKHAGSHALGFAFCAPAPDPGKMGIAWQSVNLGGAGVGATFSVWGYYENGNCPPIMCWNPGQYQNNPYSALSAGRYQYVCTNNWGQQGQWVTRSMAVVADSSGYVTIMVGGAAWDGTPSAGRVYIDDVSVK
jgi:hypothetical protein